LSLMVYYRNLPTFSEEATKEVKDEMEEKGDVEIEII